MHNKIKTTILNVINEWEMQVKAKINMDSDFVATLLAIEIYKELQSKDPAPRPARKSKEKTGEPSLLNLDLGSEVAK